MPRILHQQGLREGMATARKQGVGHLLDAGVDAAHHGNAVHQTVPFAQCPLAKHVGHKYAGGEDHQGHDGHAQTGHAAQVFGTGVHTGNQRIGSMQHDQENGVEHAHQPHEHPNRDTHGQPHQQAGDEVLFEAAFFHGEGQSLRSGLKKSMAGAGGRTGPGTAGCGRGRHRVTARRYGRCRCCR